MGQILSTLAGPALGPALTPHSRHFSLSFSLPIVLIIDEEPRDGMNLIPQREDRG